MKMTKKVSIIVPIYNSERGLRQCVDSILCQTYSNLELLLLEDGSRDASAAVCCEYATRDDRVRVFCHQNLGVSATRNCGLDLASGDYVMFIDSDDTVSPTWVEAYVRAVEQAGVGMVVGRLTEHRSDGTTVIRRLPDVGILDRKTCWKMLCQCEYDAFGYVANKLYRAELIQKNAIRFNSAMRVQEDLDFALSAIAASESILVIDEAGYDYDYIDNKREAPMRDLIHNKEKIYSYAKERYDFSDSEYRELADGICGHTYLYLRRLDPRKDFARNCRLLDEYRLSRFLPLLGKRKNEKTIVFRLLCAKKYKTLELWFRIRRFLSRNR